MRSATRSISAMLAAATVALPGFARAQGETEQVLIDGADTGWVMACALLVVIMALPGLALFYAGQVRARSAVSVFAQIGAVGAAVSLAFVIAGYTVAFGQVGNGLLGAGNAWMLIGLEPARIGTLIPEIAHALFQLVVAMFAACLLVGAWAERARFAWVVGFTTLWSLVVYAPVAHWVWGGGWLFQQVGTVDYAGGLVVHVTVGVGALVTALLIGPRGEFGRASDHQRSRVWSLAGAGLVWAGWLALNGGSFFSASDIAANAIINSHLAACTGAAGWMLAERLTIGKPTALGWASGGLSGLVAISAVAGFAGSGGAMVIGALAGPLCYFAVRLVKGRLKIDDTLDLFAIHGVGGALGTLLTAVFLSPATGGIGFADEGGMVGQLIAQAAGLGVVALWATIASAIAALTVSMAVPMRVSEEDERAGLDIASHGESA